VELSEEDPKAFELVVAWFYNGEVLEVVEDATMNTEVEDSLPENDTTTAPAFETLVRLWLLADYLLLPKLQNEVITILCRRGLAGCKTEKELLPEICLKTQSWSPLRRYLVDMCVWGGFQHAEIMYDVYGDSDDLPHEILGEIAIAYSKKDDMLCRVLTYISANGYAIDPKKPGRADAKRHNFDPSPLKNSRNYYVEVNSSKEQSKKNQCDMGRRRLIGF
jgi:hypothetical protein